MAGQRSVKLFLFIQKYYQTVGIHSPQPNQIRCSFNRKNVIFVVCSVQSIVSTTAFLLFEAKSVLDLGMPVFFLACLFLALTLYLIPIWQMRNISEFIDYCEAFIASSMYLCTQRIRIEHITSFTIMEFIAVLLTNSSYYFDLCWYCVLFS